jgi:hypothetical protein
MKLPECAYCDRPAIATVHAQWTLFDWNDRETCREHVAVAENQFWRRFIDNMPPIDVWLTVWGTDELSQTLGDSP